VPYRQQGRIEYYTTTARLRQVLNEFDGVIWGTLVIIVAAFENGGSIDECT